VYFSIYRCYFVGIGCCLIEHPVTDEIIELVESAAVRCDWQVHYTTPIYITTRS